MQSLKVCSVFFDKVISFVPRDFKGKACSKMIYGSGLFSCIQTPANFGVTFAVGLGTLEIQNMCTDEMQRDHVTIYNQPPATIFFSSPT